MSSGGGHWVQLLRLRPAFEGHDVTYCTVSRSYQHDVPGQRLMVVNDADKSNKFGILLLLVRTFLVLLRVRPDVIVSTGVAPGCLAVRLGRLFGARSAWIDSIANVDEVSLSCRLVKGHADLYLTQWQQLAGRDGLEYRGNVL